MEYIEDHLKKLSLKHKEHLEVYGDNSSRLTGHHETSSKDSFSYGVGNRAASVRIPSTTAKDKKGYLEDRRPASDMDPYVVCAMIADTTTIEGEELSKPLLDHYNHWKHWRSTVNLEM